MVSETEILRCPNCLSTLKKKGANGLECPSCHKTAKCEGPITDFSTGDLFWSYISRPKMKELVQIAQSQGVGQAVQDVLAKLPDPDYYMRLLKEDRSDFRLLLPVEPGGIALNLGSGWDGGSMGLSRYFQAVFALDGTLENLQFLVCRSREAGRTNIKFVRIDPLENTKLPFQDQSLSLVVLIGLLEWVGSGSPSGEPRALQLARLKEVCRVLKPGGCLYLAIENRFGAPYWFGRSDPHAQVPFLSILPRWAANWVMGILRGRPYRTYTHSYGGMVELLLEAGFKSTEFYMPVPEYRYPEYHVPLNSRSGTGYWARDITLPRRKIHRLFLLGIRLLNFLGLLKFFAPDFCVVATR